VQRLVEAAYRGEFSNIVAVFADWSDELAIDVGVEVAEKLAAHAKIHGDWSVWSETLHVLPHPGRSAASEALRECLRPWTLPQRPSPRSDLARLALRHLRSGSDVRTLMQAMDDANARLSTSLPGRELDDLIDWAVRTVSGGAHND
jgi:hypothetical protein